MSKWRKALKNNRRFDARYFFNERVESEKAVENSSQEEVKRNFNDFSFDSWLTEDQDLEEAHCTSKRDDKVNEEESTDKYDNDPALKGSQDNLPDSIQKAIIDKKGMDEIVGPQGKEPTFAPKPGEKEATGIKPHIVKILKKREDAAHLGPVPDDLKPEKNEG